MKKIIIGTLIAFVLGAGRAEAQVTTSAQGPGNPSYEWYHNSAARWGGRTSQVIVSNTVATAVPTTPLAARKAIAIQNLGPNAIYCVVGTGTPLNDGGLGWKISPNASVTFDLGAGVLVKCIAATADQVDKAATQVIELR